MGEDGASHEIQCHGFGSLVLSSSQAFACVIRDSTKWKRTMGNDSNEKRERERKKEREARSSKNNGTNGDEG